MPMGTERVEGSLLGIAQGPPALWHLTGSPFGMKNPAAFIPPHTCGRPLTFPSRVALSPPAGTKARSTSVEA